MANAHENIDRLSILNDLDEFLKHHHRRLEKGYYKDYGLNDHERLIDKQYSDYASKRDISKDLRSIPELQEIISWFNERGQWNKSPTGERNLQSHIGITPYDTSMRFGRDMNPPLSDFFLEAAAIPNMLEGLMGVLSGVYDPMSEANIASQGWYEGGERVHDVEGEKQLDALSKTVDAMHGDDMNILDIVGALK